MLGAIRTLAFLSAALLTASSPPALAEASRDPADVQAGEFTVDPAHTQVGFTVSHFGFSHFSGRLSEVSGTLTLAGGDHSGSKLSVTIPAKTINTPIDKLNNELVAADWLDAGKYPTITFTSTKVTPTGPDSATIIGDLTLHGVTRPVTLAAHFIAAGISPVTKLYTIGFDATGSLKRTQFGVSKYAPYIGDDVELTLHGAFEKR